MCPVVNAVQKRVHGVAQLVEVATREELSTLLEERGALCATLLLLLINRLSLQPGSVACLKPGSPDSSQASHDDAQQAADRTRHAGRIAADAP